MNRKINIGQLSVDKLEPESKQIEFWDKKLTGFGVRVSPGGSKTYFYMDRLNGKLLRLSIGRHGKIKAEQARRKALSYASSIADGVDPRTQKIKGLSLGVLLTEYTNFLKRQKKTSAKSVEKALIRNVENAFPALWEKPAVAIEMDDCLLMVKKLIAEEKYREADKLRSYLSSAYSHAINSKTNPNASSVLDSLIIENNPAASIKKVEGSSNPKKRALSVSELRAYWTHIKAEPEPRRSLMMLHLLSGGQRQTMLQRLRFEDIDFDAGKMILYDYKGLRKKPEIHVVPLLETAKECIKRITSGPYIFSCDGGKTPVNTDYFNKATKKVCRKMSSNDELNGPDFTAGVIRATVETRLLSEPYSVSSDVLASLLSHGRGGVQQKHYQHYDFFNEKLNALKNLEDLLVGKY